MIGLPDQERADPDGGKEVIDWVPAGTHPAHRDLNFEGLAPKRREPCPWGEPLEKLDLVD